MYFFLNKIPNLKKKKKLTIQKILILNFCLIFCPLTENKTMKFCKEILTLINYDATEFRSFLKENYDYTKKEKRISI